MLTKICRDCGKDKPLAEFYKDVRNKDDHKTQCKDCKKEYDRLHKLQLSDFTIFQQTILEPYEFQNGFRLLLIDLAQDGIKIELSHKEECYAINLPNEQLTKIAEWFKVAKITRIKNLARKQNAVLQN